MMPLIEYETAEGVDMIERDGWHTDTPGMVTGYDKSTRDNRRQLVAIPIERVVKVMGKSDRDHPQ